MRSEILTRYVFGPFKTDIKKLNMSKFKCKETHIYIQQLMIKIRK